MTMYHTKTPDQNGWYWVRFDDGTISMAYWTPEDGKINGHYLHERMMQPVAFMPEVVESWIGPLPCPFGEFGDSCAYFDESQYVSAIEMGDALVMTVVDGIGSDRNFGTVASHYQMPLDEALNKTGSMMRTIDRNPE